MALLLDFARHLHPHDPSELDQRPEVVLGLLADATIGYVNPAYLEAAVAGGGVGFDVRWSLGASILDAISEPLRGFYAERFAAAVATGEVWHHSYECPTPELARTFRLTALPLPGGAGLLCVHSLLVALPHGDEALRSAVEEDYRQVSGLILQCASCRRVQRAKPPVGAWEFVPDFVARLPPRTSHGLCASCAAHTWGPAAS